MTFTDFHSSGTVCSPTRAGLMTGRYQERAGIPGVVYADPGRAEHYTGLQPGEVTLPETLASSSRSPSRPAGSPVWGDNWMGVIKSGVA